jgi:3-oxoacyl-[acyl-carrier protein] reductase
LPGPCLTGAFELCQVAARDMIVANWGRIVNITSLAGRTATRVPGSHYAASKAALAGFARTLALELAPHHITVNCVAPGRVEGMMADDGLQEINDRMRKRVPAGRFGTPEDIAAAVAFLVGDEAAFITGATLDVNGGMLMI